MRRQLARWWTWLVVATTGAAAFVSLRYVLAAAPPGVAGGDWLRALTVLGQSSLLALAAMLPVLVIVLLLPRPRLAIVSGVLASTLLLAFLLLDSQVYELYRFHLNPGVLELLVGPAGSQIYVFSQTMYVQAIVILLAVLAWQSGVAVWLWRMAGRVHPTLFRGRLAAAALIGLVVPYQFAHAWADAAGFTPLTQDASLLPLAYPLRARDLFRRLGVETERNTWHLDSNGGDLDYPLAPLACPRPASPPDILFLVVDSWRFDAFSQAVTPNIWRLGAHAARFDQHFSGGNATRSGIFSLFYAIPATYWHDMLQQRRGPVFVSTLLDERYQVGIFQSASLRNPEFNETIFARIEHPRLESQGDTPAARDRNLTDDFEHFLATRDPSRPYFAFLFYDSPHAYDVPDGFPLAFRPSAPEVNYLALGADTDPRPLHNRYLNAVHYVDTLIGEVLDRLRQAGTLDSSVIVVTGDHGQEFNDNGLGYWGHNGNFTHYQTEVPLLFSGPGIAAGDRHYRTSHFDVVPTLMSRYLGCTTPADRYSVGHDLFTAGGRDMLVLGSYQDFAVLEPDRITTVGNTGLRVRDLRNRPEPGLGVDAGAVAAAVEQNSRFRKRSPPAG